MVELVNDRLGVFLLFWENYVILVLIIKPKVLKTNPKVPTLSSHDQASSQTPCLTLPHSLTHLKLSSLKKTLNSTQAFSASLRFLHAPLFALRTAARTSLCLTYSGTPLTMSEVRLGFFFPFSFLVGLALAL